ncbi:hypothetical protein AVEN_33984-1 [Araneus ventricosus]|uniref:Tumor protein p53-inducible protein 11 n=1 Tax=Araneus ventricosus TaxID=182803 RepID=A0A4Y2SV09_ARAVE|nr:hypothetical protein AVEN_33984-1 [Araneus ventricosus]
MSQISQVLGHNEHLFVKLPRCYWLWHLGMAVVFTVAGVTHIFTPYTKPDSSSEKETSQPLQMMASLYGSVLLVLQRLSFKSPSAKQDGSKSVKVLLLARSGRLVFLHATVDQSVLVPPSECSVHEMLIKGSIY